MALLAITILLALSGNASSPQKHHQVSYYWYDTNDNYVDFNTVAEEEYNLEVEYGVLVDENPMGGTLLEKGYQNPGKPHMAFPGSFLYGHFGLSPHAH